jgi:uncharacterized protein YyaL (SSP411 family)
MVETKVSWLPWGKTAFQKAKELDRPILLAISAVWCHWCHVMDKTTYSDNDVAKLVEEDFVPIRVDRDRRPDIDKRYNMGGWPTTALLTSDGDVLTGATYIPPQQMKSLLQRVIRFYRENKGNIKAKLKEIKKKEETKELPTEYGFDREFFQSIIDNLTLEISSNFDSLHGGFGDAPKFPQSGALALALLEYHIQGHKALLNIVTKTLQKMSVGGVYDKEEGGFFRYSTTRDWSVPHYEKMSEDNAKLLANYLEAYQATGEETFKETSQGILSYVDANLRDKVNGGFYGSQDADEEYYQLSLSERRKRTPPRIDKTLYTNWNAMMTSAYLLASVALKNLSLQKFALRTIDLLLNKSYSPEKGMYHYYSGGKEYLPGLLTDQASVMKCLIDAYQSTADTKFLVYAENIARFMLDNLWNVEGGFYDRPIRAEALGALKTLDESLEENSLAADAFLRLHYLTGKEKYLETARRTLEHFASSSQRYGIFAASYGVAVESYLRPVQVHIVGQKKDPVTRRFLDESLRTYNPLKVVEILDPVVDNKRLRRLKYPVSEKPQVYVCFKGTCTLVESTQKISEIVGSKVWK